jgi:hypothetical protein
MIKADRRINSATCLPLSALNCNFSGARASLPAKLAVTETRGAHSSVGQSYRLITGWSLVRVQVGPSQLPHSRLFRLNSIVGKIR